ncbi:MAG: hypothetical protein M0R80_08800 [Proteobacteria bacterium]|jgi:hypothetical protein|nr:hypothetical protein [Pseudomonadota bacterium]
MKDFEQWVTEKHPEYGEEPVEQETQEEPTEEGRGPVVKGKQKPITPWKGSWAQKEEERRKNYNHEGMDRDRRQIPLNAIPTKKKT